MRERISEAISADDRGDVRLAQALLRHPEHDRFDRIRLAELEALSLVVVDQLCEELEACAVIAFGLGVALREAPRFFQVTAMLRPLVLMIRSSMSARSGGLLYH